MSEILIRAALRDDLSRLTEIYNHYVVHTPVTFDLEPYTIACREQWFRQFADRGRYRLLIAEVAGNVVGYAGTTRLRPRLLMKPRSRPRSTAPRRRSEKESGVAFTKHCLRR